MRKSHYRDYATEAFRFLAREGPAEKYKMRIWNEAIARQKQREEATSGMSSPVESAMLRAETAIKAAEAALQDLEAAEWALIALETLRGNAAVRALKMVYMANPSRDLIRGDIAMRTAAASINIPASERAIYSWLGLARALFAEKRGLRLK